MWVILMSLLNIFAGASGLARMFVGCHNCWSMVSALMQMSEDQHLLLGVFTLMVLGSTVEIAVTGYKRFLPKHRQRATRSTVEAPRQARSDRRIVVARETAAAEEPD